MLTKWIRDRLANNYILYIEHNFLSSCLKIEAELWNKEDGAVDNLIISSKFYRQNGVVLWIIFKMLSCNLQGTR